MSKKSFLVLFVMMFIGTLSVSYAQSDAFKAPVITDEMTKDAEQNKQWRAGQSKYSAKPKNMWELGLHGGRFQVVGDVPTSVLFPGWGAGLHLRKAINYALSVRIDGFYGITKGFDDRFSTADVIANEQLIGVGADRTGMYRNFQSKSFYGAVEGILNIGNILFHKERNKWNTYLGIGLGYGGVDTRVSYKNGNAWSNLNINPDDPYKDNIEKIKNAVNFDDDYETETGNEKNVSSLFGSGTSQLQFQASLGVSRKLSKRVNLSLEHKIMMSDLDTWDGFQYRSAFDKTNQNDLGQYTSLRLGINLGNFDKRTEPLFWLNPLDGALNDVAELKQRPKFDLTDTDGDGVIDMIDQEINSPSGAPVDTRGITLDSDKDGIPDYMDDEPYSPPGYEVDTKGIAIIPDKPVTESRLNEALKNERTSWWLPMIHFDLDKYFVKPEFYPQLKAVADVMIKHPELKVVVAGFTDVRMTSEYNTVLSYKRAKAAIDYLVAEYNLPRDRFILQYGGKDDPIIPDLPASHNITKQKEMQQYINRRVEFKVATPEDKEMGQPSGPDAGSKTPGSSRKGVKYSGNSNSGY